MGREQFGLLIGWLGLFLFGMIVFEEAITFLFTKTLKKLLKTATDRLFKAIGTWVVVTSVLQSSSVVTLITIAFVWAGVIALPNALWVVLGTNIWTAITDIFFANLGIRYSLSALSLPIIGVAWMSLLIFNRNIHVRYICKFLIWLGLLFLWLGYMKESMMMLAAQVDFAQYVGYGVLLYFLIGFVITLVMQSSSTTVMLILVAAYSWIVDYRMGVPLIMWAFLGTTITGVLGAMGPYPLKKQVAFWHVFFNLICVILGLLCLPWIVALLWFSFVDIALGLSAFVLGFKIVWVLIFAPFIGYFMRFLQWLFPVKHTPLGLSLEQVDPQVTDAALIAMRQDTIKLCKKVFAYVMHVRSVDEKMLLKSDIRPDDVMIQRREYDDTVLSKEYTSIKMVEEALVAFASQAKKEGLKLAEVKQFDDMYIAVSSVVSAAKYMKDVAHNIRGLEDMSYIWFFKQYDIFRSALVRLYKMISEVIDDQYSEELFMTMVDVVADIKSVDKKFLEWLAKESGKESLNTTNLSDILHINRYVYLSSLSFVDAVKILFLNTTQKTIVENVK